MKISVVSGGFDPVHSGHIEYLKAAKNIGDYLIVALNSDNWLTLKKGKPFMCIIMQRGREVRGEMGVKGIPCTAF